MSDYYSAANKLVVSFPLKLHLFNTSLKEPLRRDQQSALFQFYHSIFSETLRKLDYRQNPIPSLHQFKLEVEQKRFFGELPYKFKKL